MQINNYVDDAFGELLHAIDQFYHQQDKDDVSRTVAIARQLVFTTPRIDDMQNAIDYLNRLDFANTPYCQKAKDRIIKLLHSSLETKLMS